MKKNASSNAFFIYTPEYQFLFFNILWHEQPKRLLLAVARHRVETRSFFLLSLTGGKGETSVDDLGAAACTLCSRGYVDADGYD